MTNIEEICENIKCL